MRLRSRSRPHATTPSVKAFIHEVQGAGETSPMVAAKVIIEGIVTADFQGSDALRGFFVQEEDADMDADPSEGIFVYDADNE
jgi:uncharacterized protein